MVLRDENPEKNRLREEEETLLSKYKIPIQHFEYSYIENCTDGRELEKIVHVLRSGEEGYFPDLTQFAENRLAVIKPKSKLLSKAGPVLLKENLTGEERSKLADDLNAWVANVSLSDNELVSYINRKCQRTLPEVRESKEEVVEEKQKTIPKKIAATDYSSWDKYDVDTEILKMDLEEESLRREAADKAKKKTVKKSVQFKESATDIEAFHQANQEKDKGNEFFKAGDYTEALRHYTNSIGCKPTAATYTNRALTNIKLKNYRKAIDDCHAALAIDPDNVKAFIRKAQALDNLGRHQEALETVELAIEIDPNNTTSQELTEKLRKKCGTVLKNTRFIVEDMVQPQRKSSSEKKVTFEKRKCDETIIPIPGTSNMSPPYYITCSENSTQKMRKENLMAHIPPQIIHLMPTDSSDVEEDEDSCPVNHLQTICTSNGTTGDSNQTILKRHHSSSNNNKQLNKNDKEKNLISIDDGNEIFKKENANKENKDIIKEDHHAGGEPCMKENESVEMPQDIHSPYSFLKTWNSANVDATLEQHASILRSIDMNRIVNVIGCKLDSAMFSKIVKCLCGHFAVPGEVDRLHSILENIVHLPRFDIIAMLMSAEDTKCVNALINFLKQHGKSLSQDVVNKFFNK